MFWLHPHYLLPGIHSASLESTASNMTLVEVVLILVRAHL